MASIPLTISFPIAYRFVKNIRSFDKASKTPVNIGLPTKASKKTPLKLSILIKMTFGLIGLLILSVFLTL
tara:strand:- start:945 stop:1154 length:210 start_codon:yes stop_codon:yes gene_type:complete